MSFYLGDVEVAVFDSTKPIVHLENNVPALGTLNNPIRTFTSRMIKHSDEPEYQTYKLPAYSDLYVRGLIDLVASEEDSEISQDMLDVLTSVVDATEDVRVSEGAVLNLASFAFAGVLMRPKGLEVKRQELDRRWHRSDLVYPEGIYIFGEIFRHRRNAVFDVANQGIVRPNEARFLQQFNDGGKSNFTYERIAEVVSEKDTNPKTISIINRLCIAAYANILLPAFDADEHQAEDLRDRFIKRGFELIDDLDVGTKIGEEIHPVSIGRNARKHVLAGDRTGGGHHIPSLNIQHKRVVSKIVSIPGGYKDNGKTQVSAAIVENNDGRKRFVDTFFPIDWTEDKVIERIQHPSRVVYAKEDNGKVTEFCVSGGVVIKRISFIDGNGDFNLITAYPSALVPEDVQTELFTDASGVKLLEDAS